MSWMCVRYALLAACAASATGCKDGAPPPGAASSASAASAAVAAPKIEYTLPPVDLGAPKPVSIGGQKVSAEPCKLDAAAPVMKHEQFGKAIRSLAVLPDGALVVLDHQAKLRRYVPATGPACELALDRSFGTSGVLDLGQAEPDRLDTLAVDGQGKIYVSGFISSPLQVAGATVSPVCTTATGRLRPGPKAGSGVLGRSKIAFGEGKCTTEEIKAEGWDKKGASIDFVRPWGDGLLVSGRLDGRLQVALHGEDGKRSAVFGDEKGEGRICYVGQIQPCQLGVCVLDANCRALRAFKTDGSFVGSGELGDLYGVGYPWPVDLQMGKAVSWAACSAKGKGQDKLHYGLLFRVRGLN